MAIKKRKLMENIAVTRNKIKNCNNEQQHDHITRLPKELKLILLGYLAPVDLTKLALMSREWYNLVNEEEVWKRICSRYQITLVKSTNINQSSNESIGAYLNRINKFKRAYLVEYNIDKNWCSRSLAKPVVLRKHDEVISCVKFDDKSRLLIGSYYLRLELWCVHTGNLLQTFKGHTDIIWGCQLAANKVVSASADQTVRIWDATTGKCLSILVGHLSTVRCLSPVIDNLVVSGSSDNTLRIWNIETGKCLKLLEGHSKTVSCVCFDGNHIVSGSYDCHVRVWSLSNFKCMHALRGHTSKIFSLLFNGEHVVSGSLESNCVIIWNVKTGSCLHKLSGFHSLQMKLRNDLLITSSSESSMKIWSLNRENCLLASLENSENQSSICCFEFNDTYLVSYSLDGYVKLWSMREFKFIRNLLHINGGAVWEMCLYKTKLFCVLVSPTLCQFGETKLIYLDFEWPSNGTTYSFDKYCTELLPFDK